MSRNPVGIRFVCAAAVVVCAAGSAAAQPADAGPYGNLFGGSGKPQAQSFDLRGGLFGGYDDTPLAQAPNGGDSSLFDPRFQAPGITSGFSSSASYRYGHTGRGNSGTRVNFGAAASVQEFSGGSSKPFWSPSYGIDTSVGTNLTPKIVLALSGTLSYAPYYQYAPFLTGAPTPSGSGLNNSAPADAITPTDGATADEPILTGNQLPQSISPVGTDAGFAARSEFVQTLNTSVAITDNFTRRSSVSLTGGFTAATIFGSSRVETEIAEARISHKLTRKVGVHVGLGLQSTRYVQDSLASSRSQNRIVDFGVDYGDGKSIAFARYYTWSFTVGTSAVRRGNDTAFQLDGSTQLTRRIGRTWQAFISAARGTSYILGFTDPFFSDSASAGFGGQVFFPRLNVSGGGTYLHGHSAFSDSGNLISKSASTKLSLGITHHVGLYAQYSFYQYEIPQGLFIGVGFPDQLNRRSASVGLSFWVPLINPKTPRQP